MSKIIFNHEEWLTPDTYCGNYGLLPDKAGISMTIAGQCSRKQEPPMTTQIRKELSERNMKGI